MALIGLMTLVSCLVRIGGDLNNVVQPSSRGFGPGVVSWPEVLVLREVHGGDDTVEVSRVVGTANTAPAAEKARLVRIYGGAVPEALFPGANPRMDLEMPVNALRTPGIGEGEDGPSDMLMVPAFTLLDTGAAPALPDTPDLDEPEPAPSPGMSLGSLLDMGDAPEAAEAETDPAVRASPRGSNRGVRVMPPAGA